VGYNKNVTGTEKKLRRITMGIHEKYYDKIYFNGELILSRENTYYFAKTSRNFYCDSPLQLALALVKIIEDMGNQINMLE
jgi:hypothetical protein